MEVQSSIPESVRRQGLAAEEIHKKLYPDQYKSGDAQTGPNAGAATPEKPASEVKPGEPAKPGEQGKTAEQARLPEQPHREPGAEEWKQKYETLQGKYNAEVPMLHSSLASLRTQLAEYQTKIASLESQLTQAKESGKETPKEKEEDEDPTVKKMRDEYPDIFDAVQKLIGPKGKKEETPAQTKEKEKAPDTSPGSPRDTMRFFLNRDVPDFEQINHDPDFIASLQVPEPSSPGKTKIQALNEAWNANDFVTVIRYFNGFKASKSSAGNPGNSNPDQKRELSREERLLAPDTGGRGPGSPIDNTPTVTPQDLQRFYNEAREGKWGPINELKFRNEEARLLAALKVGKT